MRCSYVRAPSTGASLEVKVLWELGHRNPSKPQGDGREADLN